MCTGDWQPQIENLLEVFLAAVSSHNRQNNYGHGYGGSVDKRIMIKHCKEDQQGRIEMHEAFSKVDIEEIVLKWNLKILSPSGFILHDDVSSPAFVGGTKCQYSWKINWIKPKHDDCNIYIIELYVLDLVKSNVDRNTEEGVQVSAKITISESDEIRFKSVPPSFKKIDVPWSQVAYTKINHASLLDPVTGDSIDETIPVTCRIFLKYGASSSLVCEEADEKIETQYSIGTALLCEDMKNLLNNPDFSDVTLRTPTQDFRVHKAILSARSPVFAAMFGSDMLEGKRNIVDISDADDDVLAEMLEYIYTGKTSQINSTDYDSQKSTELLRLADKYELGGLKEQSEFTLSSILTVENAAEILMLASLHNAVALKSAVVQFYHRNKKDILDSKLFKASMKAHPELLIELYEHNSSI